MGQPEKRTTVINIKGIDVELHRRMKIQAAVEGITIKDLIIKAVTEYLTRKKRAGGEVK